MKVTYDPKVDVLRILLNNNPIEESDEAKPGVILDYDKDGNIVICKNCNAPIPMNTMGEGGGCNPLPLASRTQGDTLMIPVKALESQAQRFQ